ncbi:hypothetical protein V8G54_011599 [Vigna mungo]|uniref:PPM-type phosphatase domain-containing protein n=1 Tax=Vigna mungo TaxID=3915 RepID=A0AAQ3NT79_VIGMU
MTIDHEPNTERGFIENKGGLVSNMPDAELLILASDGLWKVMANQEAIDIARRIKHPQKAAKKLIVEALDRDIEDKKPRALALSCTKVALKFVQRLALNGRGVSLNAILFFIVCLL